MKPLGCALALALVCLLGGCAQTTGERPDITTPSIGVAEPPPRHDITALLEYRSRVCAITATQRQQWLDQHRNTRDRRTRLQLLIMASCEPRRYATLLQSSAATLQTDYAHNRSYRALFTLVESFSGALAAEQKHLEKTIRGLTDIEEDIGNNKDSPADKGASK